MRERDLDDVFRPNLGQLRNFLPEWKQCGSREARHARRSMTRKRIDAGRDHRDAANHARPIRPICDRTCIPKAGFRRRIEKKFSGRDATQDLTSQASKTARFHRNAARMIVRSHFHTHANNPYFIGTNAMSRVVHLHRGDVVRKWRAIGAKDCIDHASTRLRRGREVHVSLSGVAVFCIL
ncbi:MAG: hypothetical protein AB7E67_17005 [Xanthobacteraceae bacterium]